MTELDKLNSELCKVEEQIELLSDVRKMEINRRYRVMRETILCLRSVEKHQQRSSELADKNAKKEKIYAFVWLAFIFILIWMKDDSNAVRTYAAILTIAIAFWGDKLFSDFYLKIKNNQHWLEINRLKYEISSLSYIGSVFTKRLIEIKNNEDTQNPDYAMLGAQEIKWSIDVRLSLMKEV